jgi:hypothetical protein
MCWHIGLRRQQWQVSSCTACVLVVPGKRFQVAVAPKRAHYAAAGEVDEGRSMGPCTACELDEASSGNCAATMQHMQHMLLEAACCK